MMSGVGIQTTWNDLERLETLVLVLGLSRDSFGSGN